MRVVVPYTEIHPRTEAALEEFVPQAERIFVGDSTVHYAGLLKELWADAQDVMVIEHDIEVSRRAIEQALECECWWGISPYRGPDNVELNISLGCTRFRAPFMEQNPEAIMRACSIDDGGPVCPPGHWLRLDVRVHTVLRDFCDVRPHHHTEVKHHHLYSGICACGEDHP